MISNKKAQFYIFTAVMLIGYATLLLQSFDVVPPVSKNLRQAYENFAFESDAVLNNALFAQADIDTEYGRFLDNFISYSRMKKLNVDVFAVLEHGEYIYFFNKMDNIVRIMDLNETVPPGTSTYFLRSNLSDVALEVRDDVFHENIYKFSISNQGTDAKAILRVKKGTKREIFVKE
ncbi:hypothetical protein ACFL3V_07055 [Nanoarchaeota archaeon]